MNNGGAAVKQAKISEEMITAIRMETFTEVKEGVTDYPVLDFDSRRLELLHAGVQETLKPVSYTHLDVYKRQMYRSRRIFKAP